MNAEAVWWGAIAVGAVASLAGMYYRWGQGREKVTMTILLAAVALINLAEAHRLWALVFGVLTAGLLSQRQLSRR